MLQCCQLGDFLLNIASVSTPLGNFFFFKVTGDKLIDLAILKPFFVFGEQHESTHSSAVPVRNEQRVLPRVPAMP